MKKITKPIIFCVALVINIFFFWLLEYGKVVHPDTASYLDPFLGVLAVLALSYGEMKFGVQLYCRGKYTHLKRRVFDFKFWRQGLSLAAYYIGSLVYLSVAITIYKASYLSVFALVLSPLWLTGCSRTLWSGHTGEESFYLDESAKWYKVSNVMENEEVIEIKCQAPGDRERTISIAKKKQQLDQ